MATLSGWSSELPANTSIISKFDDTYRSDKSVERNVWEEEHFWDSGSTNSAGVHRLGSFRPHYGTDSQVSQVGDEGRLMFASDTSILYDVSHSSTPPLHLRHEPFVLHPQISSWSTTPTVLTDFRGRLGGSLSHGAMIAASKVVIKVVSAITTDTSLNTGHFIWVDPDGQQITKGVSVRVAGASPGNSVDASSRVSQNELSLWTAVSLGLIR